MPYGMTQWEWEEWQHKNPGKTPPPPPGMGTGPSAGLALRAWETHTPPPGEGGRWDQIAHKNGYKHEWEDPKNIANEAVKEQDDKELASLQYFKNKATAVQDRNIATDPNVKAGREAFYTGMNTRGKESMGLLRDAAQGNAPSFAAIQQKGAIENSITSAAAAAANAGPSQFARMGAGAQGAMQSSGLAQQAAVQGGMTRAGEMSQARQAYGQGADAQASQYQALRGQELDMAMRQRGQNDKAAQAWWQLNQQQQQANRGATFAEQQLRRAEQEDIALSDLNAQMSGLGTASGLAQVGFQAAGKLNSGSGSGSTPPPTGGSDGYGNAGEYKTYDDYGNEIDSDERNKTNVNTKAHLLTQWRAR